MLHISGESWRKKAKCADLPRVSFFPIGRQASKEALEACASCLVREKCLNYALENQITHGIWGGKTESERRRMVA